MKLNKNYNGKTKLKDWHPIVTENFQAIEDYSEANDKAIANEISARTKADNEHKTAAELDHPNKSVKTRHIADESIGYSHLDTDLKSTTDSIINLGNLSKKDFNFIVPYSKFSRIKKDSIIRYRQNSYFIAPNGTKLTKTLQSTDEEGNIYTLLVDNSWYDATTLTHRKLNWRGAEQFVRVDSVPTSSVSGHGTVIFIDDTVCDGTINEDQLMIKSVTYDKLASDVTDRIESNQEAVQMHKSAAELDHPEKSVKGKHIDNAAIAGMHIANTTIAEEKLTPELADKINTAFHYLDADSIENYSPDLDSWDKDGYRGADSGINSNFPETNTEGTVFVTQTFDGKLQTALTRTGNIYIRYGWRDAKVHYDTPWTQVGNPVGAKVQFVQCAGSHDEDKINAALDKSPNIIYLVGNCTLSADNLIDITDPINPHKSIIKRCENIIIDGTYCQGIEFDGNTCPTEDMVYTVFSGDYNVRFRNCTFSQSNCTHDKHLPRLFYGGSGCSFHDCDFYDWYVIQPRMEYGGWIKCSDGLKIENCVFSGFNIKKDISTREAIIKGANKSIIENCTFEYFTISTKYEDDISGDSYILYLGRNSFVQNNKFSAFSTENKYITAKILTSDFSYIQGNYFEQFGEQSSETPNVVSPSIQCGNNSTVAYNNFVLCNLYNEFITAFTGCKIIYNSFNSIYGLNGILITCNNKNNVKISDNIFNDLMNVDMVIFANKGKFNEFSQNIFKYMAGSVTADTIPIYCTSTYSHIEDNCTNLSTLGEIAGEGTIADGNIITNEVAVNV